MKKTIGLFLIAIISVLLIACEPPAVTDVTSSIPAITLSNATLNLTVGDTKPIGITVRGFAASELRYVSEDTSIATVNAAGLVTAVAPGAVLLTASYQDLSESVVVFVLPVAQAAVAEVRLNAANEIVIVYTDGTIENTGVKGAVTATPTTITSTVVNAAGNLIITLSDGTTYNAGRVVGPSGPAGSSGGGGTGATGPAGPAGSVASLTRGELLTLLQIEEAKWNLLRNFSVDQLSGLNSLNISQAGFRTLLGITEQQLSQLVGLDGLISYNRYRTLYPGYTKPEGEWFLELNNGTLDIEVTIDVTSTLGQIYLASLSPVGNSGMHGIDYKFVSDGLPASDADRNNFATSGTIFIGTQAEWNALSPMEKSVIEYGSQALMDQLNAAWAASGLSQRTFKNSGVSNKIPTLKGALLESNSAFPGAVSLFNRSFTFNEFVNTIRPAGWVVTSGLVDSSGLFVTSDAEVKVRFEPSPTLFISSPNSTTSYLTNFSQISTFLNDFGITQTVASSTLFGDNSGLLDGNGKLFNSSEYYVQYYIPMYPSTSPLYNSGENNNIVYPNGEGFYLAGANNVDIRDDRNLTINLYRSNITYTNSQDHPYTATLQSNQLRSWDIFYTVVDSGLNKIRTGVLVTSGYNVSSGTSVTSGLGYVQVTNPLGFRKSFVSSGLVFFVTASADIPTPAGLQSTETSWTFLGVTTSGLKSTFVADGRNDFGELVHTLSNLNTAVTFNEGDLFFIRQEANELNMDSLNQRFMYVYDTVSPLVEPIALLSSNQAAYASTDFVTVPVGSGLIRRPSIAKAGDLIDILIRANEPVIYSYNVVFPGGTVLFKSSGQVFHSGFTSQCGNTPPDSTRCAVGVSGDYTTLAVNSIRPVVSANDIEGYFNFSGLTVRDRAGNPTLINSEQFVGFSGLWIDPIKPAITSSGFVNNTVIYSGVAQEANIESSGVTPTSGVGALTVYLVSGVLDYNVTIRESFNEITSGAVSYQVYLRPTAKFVNSGFTLVGEIPVGFFNSGFSTQIDSGSAVSSAIGPNGLLLLESRNYIGESSGFSDFDHKLDTNSLENGMYELYFDLLDYAGNTNVVTYYINVENPLQYVDVTLFNEGSGIVSLNFSNTIVQSGANSLLNTDFEMLITRSGGTTISTSTRLLLVQVNPRSILIRVNVNEGEDQFKFELGDSIRIEIKASGIAKMFDTMDEAIIETSDNRRTLSNWPSNMN